MARIVRQYTVQVLVGTVSSFLLLASCTDPATVIPLHDLHPAALIAEDQRVITSDEAGAGSFFRSFHPPSDTGRVIHGFEAFFGFRAVSDAGRILNLTLAVPGGGGTIRVFTSSGALIGEGDFDRGTHILPCRISGQMISPGLNRLRISWSPRSGMYTRENRLIVIRGDMADMPGRTALSHASWDSSGTKLTLDPGCTYSVFVIPDDRAELSGNVFGRDADAAVLIAGDGGRTETLWESGELDRVSSFSRGFPEWSESAVTEIRFVTKPGNGSVEWSHMRLSGVSDSPFRIDTAREQRLPRPSAHGNRFNVIVYLVDTVRKDRLQIYGYDKPTTPHLQAHADKWFIWDDCQSMSSWTKPSTATLLTGLDPVEHGINAETDSLKRHVRLIWSEAHDAGYETSCFITNGHIREKWGFARDVDHFEYFPPERGRRGHTLPADSLHGSILSWLDTRADPNRPFFCYVHASDPHAPYAPPPAYMKEFYPLLPETLTTVSGQDVNKLNCPAGTFEPWQPVALSALYDAEIAAWESDFSDLLTDLDLRGILDKTLVVLTSDHGEEFADHGMFFHGRTLYNEQIDVPFLIRIPGEPGERLPVRMDLGDAGDLLAWIFDGNDVRDWQPPERYGRPSLVLWRGFQRARFEWDNRAVIWNISPLKACNIDAPELEVFRADPREQTSLADDYAVTADACRAALNEWWSRRLREERHVSMELDNDTVEMLKMLGYMPEE